MYINLIWLGECMFTLTAGSAKLFKCGTKSSTTSTRGRAGITYVSREEAPLLCEISLLCREDIQLHILRT